jgi:hypothetical protein
MSGSDDSLKGQISSMARRTISSKIKFVTWIALVGAAMMGWIYFLFSLTVRLIERIV